MIAFSYFFPSDEVSTFISVFHQRHGADELASPVGIVVFEAADGEDEVWRHVHQLAHSVNVRLRGVLVRWCPPFDDGAHGRPAVRDSVRSQQPEGSPVAPLHRLELEKTLVVLLWEQTLPLILASADIQRIAISNPSWNHNFKIKSKNLNVQSE